MHFDASGIIHAWDEYPIAHFPSFWEWVEKRVKSGECKICEEIFQEVKHTAPECAKWLEERDITRIRLSNEILVAANEIKELLDIEEESYHPDGVDENDLFVIATAKMASELVLTNEARQPILPQNKRRYKIPAVCALPEVSISHQNVREWIVASGEVFG